MERRFKPNQMQAYGEYLYREERARNTIEKYLHDLRLFADFCENREITKELVSEWKEHLLSMGKAAVTVNSALAALHGFFAYMGWNDCRVKYLKIQRQVFRDASRELNREDFKKLVNCANSSGNYRLALIMETICATGIRVSETKYITLEAIKKGRADISLKGKIRTILIPNKLAQKLKKYAHKQKIVSGEIFLTANGRGMCRRQIWSEMKRLCRTAGVDESKVFPHNLRHLFARAFYRVCRDIVRLADVLGHSSIETTRIYLITSGTEHARQLERLGLIS